MPTQFIKQSEMADAAGDAKVDHENIRQKKPLIQKRRGESFSQFYERAEKAAIGRRCINCGLRRRYAMVQCPQCKWYPHEECEFRVPDQPVEGVPKPQQGHDLSATQSFAPNPDYDPSQPVPDGLTEMAVPQAPQVFDKPFDQMTNKELELAAANIEGFTLPKSAKSKADKVAAIEDHFGKAGSIDLGQAQPTPSDATVVLDKEGHNLANNQLGDANDDPAFDRSNETGDPNAS